MCLFGRCSLVTVVWRSFLEIYETFKKQTARSGADLLEAGRTRVGSLLEHKAMWQSSLLLDCGALLAGPSGALTSQGGGERGAARVRAPCGSGGSGQD